MKKRQASMWVGAVTLGLASALAGCKGKEPAPAPPPQAVRVRLAPLAARHPLASEVARLRQAEAAFAALVRKPQAGVGGGDVLPGLPPLGPVRTDPNLGGRRQRERERLQRTAARGLARYAQEREARRQSLQEQRRIELTAALRARDADADRLARLAVEQEVANKIAALAEDRLKLEAALGVINGQLDQQTLTVGPANAKDLEAEIAKIEESQKVAKVEGVSPRARLEYRRRRFQARLDALLVDIEIAKRDGKQKIAQLAARSEAERNRQIAEQLQGLQQDQTLTRLGREQQVALRNVLSAEATGAQLERQVMRIAGRADAGNAPLRLEALQGAGAAPSPSLAEALQRIRKQRERLNQFIEESVAEAVRDTAHQHNLTVTLMRDAPGMPGNGQKQKEDRVADRTSDFMRWIRWGEPLPKAGQ